MMRMRFVAILGIIAVVVPAAFAQGVVQRDTGGLSMGGVNAVNKVGAGVTQPLPSIQADGVSGVNAVNMRHSGVKQRPKSIMADVPRNDGMFAVSSTVDTQMKRVRP